MQFKASFQKDKMNRRSPEKFWFQEKLVGWQITFLDPPCNLDLFIPTQLGFILEEVIHDISNRLFELVIGA